MKKFLLLTVVAVAMSGCTVLTTTAVVAGGLVGYSYLSTSENVYDVYNCSMFKVHQATMSAIKGLGVPLESVIEDETRVDEHSYKFSYLNIDYKVVIEVDGVNTTKILVSASKGMFTKSQENASRMLDTIRKFLPTSATSTIDVN